MTPASPYEVAIAVARAQQTDPDLARTLLCDYNNEGLSMLRVVYAMSRILAQADVRICQCTARDQGDWLATVGQRVATDAPRPGAG